MTSCLAHLGRGIGDILTILRWLALSKTRLFALLPSTTSLVYIQYSVYIPYFPPGP